MSDFGYIFSPPTPWAKSNVRNKHNPKIKCTGLEIYRNLLITASPDAGYLQWCCSISNFFFGSVDILSHAANQSSGRVIYFFCQEHSTVFRLFAPSLPAVCFRSSSCSKGKCHQASLEGFPAWFELLYCFVLVLLLLLLLLLTSHHH